MLNKILGLAFGVVRASFIAGWIYIGMLYIFPANQLPKWVVESHSRPILQASARWSSFIIMTFRPTALDDDLKETGGGSSEKIYQQLIKPKIQSKSVEEIEGYLNIDRSRLLQEIEAITAED